MGGFSVFAHVRSNDQRPGPGSYVIPGEFGPNSSSLKKTILGKSARSGGTTLADGGSAGMTAADDGGGEGSSEINRRVGPGSYALPSYIGTGRAATFASHSPPLKPGGAQGNDSGVGDAAGKGGKEKAAKKEPPPQPMQYSMALTPGSPTFLMHGKGTDSKTQARNTSRGLDGSQLGPGSYHLPSMFDPRSNGVSKGPTITGKPHDPMQGTASSAAAGGVDMEDDGTMVSSAADVVPGPGSYRLLGFADEVILANSKRKEVPVTLRRHMKTNHTPGPGAYEDPTSISSRLGLGNTASKHQSSTSGRNAGDGAESQQMQKSRVNTKLGTVRMHPTFGGRFPWPPNSTTMTLLTGESGSPGPGSYELRGMADACQPKKKVPRRQSKKGSESSTSLESTRRLAATREKASLRKSALSTLPGPGEYSLPSEFTNDPRKGVSMKWRRETKDVEVDVARPGSETERGTRSGGIDAVPGVYDLTPIQHFDLRGRFGPPPLHNPRSSARRQSASSSASSGRNSVAGSDGSPASKRLHGSSRNGGGGHGRFGPSYNVKYGLVEPRVIGGTMSFHTTSMAHSPNDAGGANGSAGASGVGGNNGNMNHGSKAGGPGPGSYNLVDYLAIAPRDQFDDTTAADTTGTGAVDVTKMRSQANARVPLSQLRGTCFFKGAYDNPIAFAAGHPTNTSSSNSGVDRGNTGLGPGAYYNDDTWASKSIQGNQTDGKGFTFGIRYPAETR